MQIPILRPFQNDVVSQVYKAWDLGSRNVLMRADTGAGKTVMLSHINRLHRGHSRIIAHRQELVSQLSLAVARNGVRHNVITSDSVRRGIAKAHIDELGRSFIDPNSLCHVGSVDTMIRRVDANAANVTLWTVDEGHHVVTDNKWHRLLQTYTNVSCRGLLPTATPLRADGKGLGRDNDGVADCIIEAPPMRWLIGQGYLSDYRIFCPPSDLQMLSDVAASGDWSTKQLQDAAKQSRIVGDVVESYIKYASGKLGITFATDIATAIDIAQCYNLAGVKAETLTGKTDDALRRSILRKFSNREIDQIVAVDIISEGFDLPAIEVASFARPTQSLALYMQQFGRALRISPGKDKAIIIDHVGNVVRHNGPPDKPRVWTLNRRDKRAKTENDCIPIKVCVNCFEPYEAYYAACSHCGHKPLPKNRESIAAVAGEISELSQEVLAALRLPVVRIDMPVAHRRTQLIATGLPHIPLLANIKRHAANQSAQNRLRLAMANWAGYAKSQHPENASLERVFYYKFGISTIEAVVLGVKDADALFDKIYLDGAVNMN